MLERRKIIALGQSSRVVSLPKDWMRRNNIDQGDWLFLQPLTNGRLYIYPTEIMTKEMRSISITISTSEKDASITRKIIGAYMDGHTIIKLVSEKIFTVNQQTTIRKISGILYMMIIESDANSITLETLINEDRASISSSIERMHLITLSMFRDTINAIIVEDKILAESVLPLENDVDQLMFFILRLIRSCAQNLSLGNHLRLDPLDCLDYQNLVQSIERVADHISAIAKSIVELGPGEEKLTLNLSENLIKAAEITLSSYDLAIRSFLSSNVDSTNEIIDSEVIVNKLCDDLQNTSIIEKFKNSSEFSDYNSIKENIKRISQYVSDIAEMTIDRAYKRTVE